MSGNCKITLTGANGLKIEKRTTSQGKSVCDITVRLSFFGAAAEVAKQLLESGQTLNASGKMQVDTWHTSGGKERQTLDVTADEVSLGATNTTTATL